MLLQAFSVQLHCVLDAHGVMVVRKHVLKLHHAGRATGGHNLGSGSYHIVALALADLARIS